MADNVIPSELEASFRKNVAAAQADAKRIMAIKRDSLESGKARFVHIRAVRMDHLAREVNGNESLRK